MIRRTKTQMNHRLYGLGRFKLLVTEPHHWAYGHLATDILMSLQIAKAEGAAVFFVQPRQVVNRALFELRSEQVRILPRTGWRPALIRILWSIMTFPEKARRFIMSSRLIRKSHAHTAPYFRRLLIREPIPVFLPESKRAEATELVRQLGITPDTKIVTLHVRETGFKLARGYKEPASARVRDARIETYYEAIDFLINRDYTIVRIGDSSMTPVSRKGVIDLATSPLRTELLELYCLMKSEFLLGCDSGPSSVVYLTNTPCLAVNVTDPASKYPVRRDGLYILKHAVESQTGRRLSLVEMMSEEYLQDVRKPMRYEYIDNSSDEILEAVREMIDTLENGLEETPVQREYRQLLCRAVDALKDKLWGVRKWGPEGDFLGDGRIAHSFAAHYLYNP